MLENYTSALGTALGSRAEQMQITFDNQLQQLDASLGNRTENLQTVFEEYARALDAALANRAQALDYQLVERTRSLDEAFGERLRLFDESIMRSTSAIDTAVVDKTQALTNALDAHAVSFRETIGKQATDLDEALMHGINSVRRASENITRQSIKAMEGLAGQSDLLKNISENLLGQISGVTGRFENQGQQIMKAANALETANFKIDKTLQNRHAELAQTLDRLSGKADEFSSFVGDYSSTMEGSLSEADLRARGELERMRAHTSAESERTLEDLRHRLTSVSTTMTTELGSLSNRFAATSEEMRQQASRAAADIAAEQARLRTEMERLPVAAHESSEGMRRALHDQIKALDQLSQLAARSAVQRDVTRRRRRCRARRCRRGRSPRRAPEIRRARSRRCPPPSRRSSATGSASAARRPPTTARAGRSAISWRVPRATRKATGNQRRRSASASASRLQPRPRSHRARPRSGHRRRHLAAPALRAARRHGAQHLRPRGARRVRRRQPPLPQRRRLIAHGEPLPRRLRAHRFGVRRARSVGTPVARPAHLRHRPRLPVPRPRFRSPRLTSAMAAPAEAHLVEAKSRGVAAGQAVRHRPRRQDRGACRRRARRRRRPQRARRGRSLCALRRKRRRRGQGPRGLQGPLTRARLPELLPAGAARNALDCALWDLEAKQAGKRAWELAGLAPPQPAMTCYTLSLGDPAQMAADAKAVAAPEAAQAEARRCRRP